MTRIKLEEICDLENGYAFKSSDYIDESNTLNCRMSNIRPDGSFDILYNAKYLPDQYAEIYKKFLLKDGDLIIAMTDMAGDPKILGVPTVVDTKGFNLLLNQRVGKLILLKEKSMDILYLKYALSNKSVRNYLKRFAGGGLQLNVGKNDLLSIPIVERSLSDQQDVSKKLDTLVKIKDLNVKQLAEYDSLIKSRFVEMFGSGDYATLELINVIRKGAGLSYGIIVPGENVNEGIPMIRPSDFDKGQLHLDSVYRVDYEIEKKYKKTRLEGNEILIQVIGQPGQVMLTNPKCIGMNVTRNLAVIRHDEALVNKFYLKEFLLTQEAQNSMLGGTNQSTLKQLPLGTLKKLHVPLPPLELQNEFGELVQHIDKLKLEVQRSLDETEILFDSLMQVYFE